MQKIDIDLERFETQLSYEGGFDELGAEPGTEVAIRPDLQDGGEWILGRVLHFYRDTGFYDIADVDDSRFN